MKVTYKDPQIRGGKESATATIEWEEYMSARKEPSTRELARLVRQIRKEAEALDLRGFPQASNVPDGELAAIKTTATQTLEVAECILGGRGIDAQEYHLRREARDSAAELLAGIVLLHKGLTSAEEA